MGAEFEENIRSPITKAEAVSDASDHTFTNATRSIYVGGAGNLVVVLFGQQANMDGGSNSETEITFDVQAGTMLPLRVKKIKSTSTATKIIGCF